MKTKNLTELKTEIEKVLAGTPADFEAEAKARLELLSLVDEESWPVAAALIVAMSDTTPPWAPGTRLRHDETGAELIFDGTVVINVDLPSDIFGWSAERTDLNPSYLALITPAAVEQFTNLSLQEAIAELKQ